MRTVDGVQYDTFRDACCQRGLLDDDNDLRMMLEDAIHFWSGTSLRSLFLSILRESFPAQPLSLWNQYKPNLCDDLPLTLKRLGFPTPSPDTVHDYGLYLLQTELDIDCNKKLSDLGLFQPQTDWNTLLGNNLFCEHRSFDAGSELQRLLSKLPLLNTEQRLAFNTILDAIQIRPAQVYFVEGAAGAGKTFLYQVLCHALRSEDKIVLCVASSSIAALLLPGGRTAHSCFKIPINIQIDSVCSLSRQSAFATFVKQVSFIIWDECSMQHRFALEAVDRSLQDLRDTDLPFGGITTVLGGDFLQTLPVVKRENRSLIVHSSLLSSPLWPPICPYILRLHQNMRLTMSADDREFALWLRKLARGDLNNNDVLRLPARLLCPANSINELI